MNRRTLLGTTYTIAIIAAFVVGIGMICSTAASGAKIEKVQKEFGQNFKIWVLSDSQYLLKDTVSETIYYIECSNMFNSNITNIKTIK